MRQIEMMWRCSSCSVKNRGRDLDCRGCGNPKDDSEPYEMPDDTRSAPSVTDRELLRIARGGPNWTCLHCGSHQRRADGSCLQCGGSERTGSHTDTASPASRDASVPLHKHPGVVASVAGVVVVSAFLWFTRERTYESEVAAVRWDRTIAVERYRVHEHEGWRDDMPSSAFEVVSLGQRVHHYDRVLDGYDSETYTASVSCGETCVAIPRSCTESCTPNGNGFATCRDVCSGGGQSCSTRYCSELRTRQVPHYRREPRYAEQVRYEIWEWGHDRTAHSSGSAIDDLWWPEAAVGVGLADGEREREVRSGKYVATFVYDGDDKVDLDVGETNFSKFDVGTHHMLTIKGASHSVDGLAVERVQ